MRFETNIQFICTPARLQKYSNAKRQFGYTLHGKILAGEKTGDFGEL